MSKNTEILKRRRKDVQFNQKPDSLDLSLDAASEINSVGESVIAEDIENIFEAFDFKKPHSLALKEIIGRYLDDNVNVEILPDLASCFLENLNSIDHRHARLNECLETLNSDVRLADASDEDDGSDARSEIEDDEGDDDRDGEYVDDDDSLEGTSTCSEIFQPGEIFLSS